MNLYSKIKDYTILLKIGAIADKMNLKTYVIGGFVRDLLLNIPSKDIDIVCLGNGLELANSVAYSLDNNPKVTFFKNFGTAQIKYGNYEIEFVGARKESYNKNSRNPIVQNGSLQDDQLRRDFTINALAISLNKNNFGSLIDPFDGMKHLKEKILETPLDPDKTFFDDPLRMMRAVRFATKLKFNISEHVFKSIQKNVDRIKIVSQERITKELNLTLMYDRPSKGMLLFYKSGLLEKFLPEFCKLLGKEIKQGFTHKDNFYHTLKVLDNVSQKSDNLWLRWVAVLHDIAKPMTKKFDTKKGFSFHGHEDLGSKMVPKIFKRLKLPLGKNMIYVQKLIKLHLRPISLVNDIVTDTAVRRLIYEAGEDIDDLMMFSKADVTSENKELYKQHLSNLSRVEKKIHDVEEMDKIKSFKNCISGKMIMDHFNIKPSEVVGLIKNEIKEAIINGEIKNEKEQALPYMKKIGSKILQNLKNRS